MPREKVALCILSDAYTAHYDRETKWLTLFLGGGPRRNLSPATTQKLGTFLTTMNASPEEQPRVLGNEYMPERLALHNQHAAHYTAAYSDECLTLSLDTEQLEFSAESTRLLREFLEKELSDQERK
jgi:hypothetical protein